MAKRKTRNIQNPLKQELKYFKDNKNEFLKHYQGRYILIKNKEVIGSFTTEQEAYQAGVKQFGENPFLIKQVLAKEQTAAQPALTTGLIYAGS